jgi:hypothetical protein
MSEQSDDIETRRDRLIKYLLDEVEPEEKFEIERLCNLDADWRAEKKLVQQSLSLFQDAGLDGFRIGSGMSEELSFSQEEKTQLLEKLKNMEPQGKADDQRPSSKWKLHFWAPLAVAAAALVIAYFGTLERKNEEELMLAKADAPKEELKERDAANQAEQSTSEESDKNKQDSFLLEDSKGLELASGAKLSMAGDKQANAIKQVPQGESIEPTGEEILPPLVPGINPTPTLLKAKKLDIPSKLEPVNWSSLLGSPRTAFLHLENGDALGRVKLMGFSSDTLEFKRADWPIQERSFALSRGKYQIRITDNTEKIYLLEGEVQKLSSVSRSVSEPEQEAVAYEMLVDMAWRLADDEKRLEVDF